VVNVQDFDGFSFHGIDPVGEWCKQQFSRTATVAGPASVGCGFKGTDAVVNRPHSRLRKMRIVLFEIILDAPLNRRLEQSNEHASRLEHALHAGVHLFFLDKLTAFCCGNSLFDRD
jgi:hypothetical protein